MYFEREDEPDPPPATIELNILLLLFFSNSIGPTLYWVSDYWLL